MTQGRHYVEAIDLLLDAELHRINLERDEQVVSVIRDLLSPYAVDPRSRRLAGALRSIRTLKPGVDEDKRIQVFKERFVEFRAVGDAQLSELILALEEKVMSIDSALYSKRTRISTISTVMRPLATKWLERWREQRGGTFDYQSAVVRVNHLIQMQVETEQQFSAWLQDVFELFNELVIFKKPREDSINMPKRPMGMVGESNLRIYVRNWSEWTEHNFADLMTRASQLADGKVDSAYLSSYRRPVDLPQGTPNMIQGYEIQQPYSIPVNAFQSPSQPSKSFKVSVESVDPNAGEASRSWPSAERLLTEVGDWLSTITALWGPSGAQIHVSITTTDLEGESSIRLPNKDSVSAIEAIKTYVSMNK
jgi:hypothetical protein